MITLFKIIYKLIDGAHFFTSDEPLLRGLCAAHNDYRVALQAAYEQAQELLAWNSGLYLSPVVLGYGSRHPLYQDRFALVIHEGERSQPRSA